MNSWRNSLRAVSQVIDDAKLHDHGILLEYQLPMTSKRLDCMVTGTDADRLGGQSKPAINRHLKTGH